MLRVLLVTPDLAHGSAGQQLALLAAGLPRQEFDVRVCVLGRDGPLAERLRRSKVAVDLLGGARRLDLRPLYRLRRVLASWRPAMIHTWRAWGLRAMVLAANPSGRPLLVSHLLRPGQRSLQLGWFDRWLTGRADCVLATGSAEAERCRRLGVAEAKITVVAPGVDAAAPSQGPAKQPPREGGRYLLCAGPLEPHKGFRDAIWAFDVLRRAYPELRLLIVGSGSDRPRLEGFSAAIDLQEHVHFIGEQADVTGLLAHAEAVWVPSRVDAGVTVALEAMAVGRPVVASRLPALAEVIADGQTGVLVPPGDKVALAKQTRRLLDDPEHGRELGAAGRRRVSMHFTAEGFVRRVAKLYREVAA